MNGNAAAIGTFDGVHLGHAAVISCLKEIASEKGLQPIAITFDRHPLSLIAPERAPLSITTIHKKEDLLSKAGVVPVVVPFDESLRSTTASDWMKMLRDDYNVEAIVVGYDNTFGCDGVALSVADYKEIGSRLGIEVTEAPFVAGISSSAIRKAISSGRIEEANAMLGRKFSLPGVVVEGNKLGRTIGFPTANILPHAGIVLPGNGVYAAFATLPDGSRRGAMVNVGTRPTVRRGNNMTIEAHILGWKGDIYGMPIKLTFVARMRDEEKFNSIEALRRQLEKDTAKTQIFRDKVSRQEK